MKEKIGNVILNLDNYSGKDLYSDGKVEDELLEIVKNYSESEFSRIISDRANWPILYHLSPIRTNLIEWIDFRKEKDTVLEIGSGCGAITGVLAEKARTVTCIELSKRRSTICATRHHYKNNIEIYVGNFEDIESELPQFDIVTLIGVLEYAGSYLHVEEPYLKLLEKSGKHLKPGGRLILAIENKLGMKYWAGCPEDHTGRMFDSIEGYSVNQKIRTFSRKELSEMLCQAGYESFDFFYPFPDYKLPLSIYSDFRLPQEGDLSATPCMSGNRIMLFEEEKAFNSILEAGLFPDFSNSFLLIANKGEN